MKKNLDIYNYMRYFKALQFACAPSENSDQQSICTIQEDSASLIIYS